MINKILRWLFVYVIFTATGKFPERLINLAMLSGINIINPIGEKGKFTAQVSISDYKELYNIRKASSTKLKIVKKKGLPFVLYKNRKRKGLIVGAVIFVAVIQILSMFIWSVDISGNRELSTYVMQCGLKDNGIYVGALKKDINVESIERAFSLEIGNVGWISVNLVGCTADVKISESYNVPKIVEQKKPCNLKATKSGQIIKMDIREGQNAVAIGDGVAKGQLLVSGIFQIGDTGTSRFVHSDGEVYAGVKTKEEIIVPKQTDYNKVNELQTRGVLKCMGLKFPLNFAQVDNVYSRSYIMESFILNDIKLPFKVITENNFSIENKKVKYNKKQAEKLAETELALNDIFERWDSNIQKRKMKTLENKDNYTFNAEYYTIENIAEEIPINIVN